MTAPAEFTSPRPTRVFIVDDHALVREWLGHLLRYESDLVVAGEADDAPLALAAMIAAPPDVAVIDISLKRGSGLDLIKQVRAQLPAVEVVVLSMHDTLGDVQRAFRAGAAGYVMKSESTAQIVTAIRAVRSGRLFANPKMLAELKERFMGRPTEQHVIPMDVLSDREVDVFRRLGEGQSTREISDQLGVSLKTVQTYCARIKEKLALDDRQELGRVAYRWRHAQAQSWFYGV